jgi:hypothetical protein
VASLSISFMTVETFEDRAPQLVCEMHPWIGMRMRQP